MFWLCRTCGVEHSAASGVCAICADERQWVPSEGQLWATLDDLTAEGMKSQVRLVEDGLVAIGSSPALGIGQLGKLVCSDAGNVLWDPSGFLDDDAVAAGDTIFPNPDRRTVGFLRSYPNRLPLSAAVVERMAATLAPLCFDRIYGLFTNAIDTDGHAAVQRSAV